MTIVRRSDWEDRLSRYLGAAIDKPHVYGTHDCMLFPAGAVKAMTGRDFGRGHRGKYRSAAEARRYLDILGFASVEAMIDSLLPEKPAAFAQRGDIVLCDGIPGICIGGEAVFVGADGDREGFVREPRARFEKVWAV